MKKLSLTTADQAVENAQKIANLFPHCVSEDGKIDFDLLQQELSSQLIDGQERYQLNWVGKRQAIVNANQPITKTLRPVRAESVNFDSTENLFIEGDNLDALKLLQETYLGKVKMIYIDPPYNTGNDFIYRDDFSQDAESYALDSEQKDEQGNRLTANPESNGRFHSDWLSMIYPRLKIAHRLLRDDGVIFISIDDNEQANLKKVCDEIFGADNFRNTLLVKRRIKSLNSQFADEGLNSLNIGFEYVLVYSKTNSFSMNALRMIKQNASSKGRWDVFWSNADRPTMRYDVLGFIPETGQWRYSKEKADIAVKNYKTYLEKYANKLSLEEYYEQTGSKLQFIRRIENGTGKNGGVQHWIAPSNTALRTSIWTDIEVSQIHKEIDLPFSNPKSKELILELIKLASISENDLILDFFAGSATTAHAVMQLNAQDNGKRKFIMVQLPEKIEKGEFATIAEISKERIRRAGVQILQNIGENQPLVDVGFRVLKIDSSNMQPTFYTPSETQQDLLNALTDNIKPDRTAEDLLFQTMLALGVDLSSPIEQTEINGKTVFKVNDNQLIACFDGAINDALVQQLAQQQPQKLVFRESGFASDSAKINTEQIVKQVAKGCEVRVI